jgi:hypothetical protein
MTDGMNNDLARKPCASDPIRLAVIMLPAKR